MFRDVLWHTARIGHFGGHGQMFDFSKDEFYSLRRQALITSRWKNIWLTPLHAMSVLTFDSPGSKFRSRCFTVIYKHEEIDDKIHDWQVKDLVFFTWLFLLSGLQFWQLTSVKYADRNLSCVEVYTFSQHPPDKKIIQNYFFLIFNLNIDYVYSRLRVLKRTVSLRWFLSNQNMSQ